MSMAHYDEVLLSWTLDKLDQSGSPAGPASCGSGGWALSSVIGGLFLVEAQPRDTLNSSSTPSFDFLFMSLFCRPSVTMRSQSMRLKDMKTSLL